MYFLFIFFLENYDKTQRIREKIVLGYTSCKLLSRFLVAQTGKYPWIFFIITISYWYFAIYKGLIYKINLRNCLATSFQREYIFFPYKSLKSVKIRVMFINSLWLPITFLVSRSYILASFLYLCIYNSYFEWEGPQKIRKKTCLYLWDFPGVAPPFIGCSPYTV